MPEISRFFGIIIRIYTNDHPPPHFHAVYGSDEALIIIDTLETYRGSIPRRALSLVLEWAQMHRDELRRDWELASAGQLVEPIPPLE